MMDKIKEIKNFYFDSRHSYAIVFQAVLVDIPFLVKKVEELTEENAALAKERDELLKRPTFAEGFKAGKDAVLRNNKSGCCCLFNEDDDLVSLCGAHKEREEALTKENAGLREYSESRDESIKVYREEIRELKTALNNATENRWGAWEIERAEVKGDNMAKEFRIEDLEQEIKELKERLKGIEEVYEECEGTYWLEDRDAHGTVAYIMWQAIKKACEEGTHV